MLRFLGAAMSFVRLKCKTCGKFHGAIAAGVLGRFAASTLSAANSNFMPVSEPKIRKKMSAQDAMALTALRYKETLDYLK